MQNDIAIVPINVVSKILRATAKNAIETNSIAKNIYIHGTMGVGKSAIVHQLKDWVEQNTDKKAVVIDIRLSAMQSHDVLGIPYNAESGEMLEVDVDGEKKYVSLKNLYFSTPSWFPDTDDEETFYILFLDEFSNGSKDVQQAAYRILLDRSIQNGKTMGTNTMIVAAGNLQSDNTGAKAILPAASNRFSGHFQIDTDIAYKPWLDWALNEGDIYNEVFYYINADPQALIDDDIKGRLSFARPRTWEDVSDIMKNPEYKEDEELLYTAIRGAIGTANTLKFKAFIENRKFLPNFEMLEKTGEFEVPEDLSAQLFIASPFAMRILANLKTGEDEALRNLTDAALRLPKETRVVLVRALKLKKDLITKVLTNEHTKKLTRSITESM